MRIFLSARYGRRLELCGYRDELIAMGHTVTSRWLDGSYQINPSGVPIGDDGETMIESGERDESREANALRREFVQDDIEDVLAADCIINFTEPPESDASRGGRHVELGISLGMNIATRGGRKLIFIVGHRENLFHWLPEIEFYKTWEEVKRCLTN